MPAPLEIAPHATPNPNGLKFDVNRTLTDKSLWFATAQAAAAHPLARAVLLIPGVKSFMIGATFVSVVKEPSAAWETLVPQVEAALRQQLG